MIAGIGGGFAAARAQARNAERAGAHGLLPLPPYLVNSEQDGPPLAFVSGIAAVTSLPLIIYSRDNGIFRVDTVLKLAEAIPTLIGVKDGTSDLDLVLEPAAGTPAASSSSMAHRRPRCLAAQSFAIGVNPPTAPPSSPSLRFSRKPSMTPSPKAIARCRTLLTSSTCHAVLRRKRAGNAVSIVKAGLGVTGHTRRPRPPAAARPQRRRLRCAEDFIAAGTAIAEAKR